MHLQDFNDKNGYNLLGGQKFPVLNARYVLALIRMS